MITESIVVAIYCGKFLSNFMSLVPEMILQWTQWQNSR